jgi:hypothetical protein
VDKGYCWSRGSKQQCRIRRKAAEAQGYDELRSVADLGRLGQNAGAKKSIPTGLGMECELPEPEMPIEFKRSLVPPVPQDEQSSGDSGNSVSVMTGLYARVQPSNLLVFLRRMDSRCG